MSNQRKQPVRISERDDEDMREMRNSGARIADIAEVFGVSYSACYMAVTNRTWRDYHDVKKAREYRKRYRMKRKAAASAQSTHGETCASIRRNPVALRVLRQS